MVDIDGGAAERSEGALRPERHVAEIIVVADAGEDEVGAVSCLGRRRGEPSAEARDPIFSLLPRAVEHGNVVPPTALEMAGYGKAHYAEPDKGDLAHVSTHVLSLPGSTRLRAEADRFTLALRKPFGGAKARAIQ